MSDEAKKYAVIKAVNGGFIFEWRDDSLDDEWQTKQRSGMYGLGWEFCPDTSGTRIFTTGKALADEVARFFSINRGKSK